jgi:hypothetical protein
MWLAQEIAHNPATSRLWEHGLYVVLPAAIEPKTGEAGLVGVCPEGDAWALVALEEGLFSLIPTSALVERTPWLADASGAPTVSGREPTDLQSLTLLLAYDLTVSADGVPLVVDGTLARGPGPDQALAHLRAALTGQNSRAMERRDEERNVPAGRFAPPREPLPASLRYRLALLDDFYTACVRRLPGVSLRTRGGLYTYLAGVPLQFRWD